LTNKAVWFSLGTRQGKTFDLPFPHADSALALQLLHL